MNTLRRCTNVHTISQQGLGRGTMMATLPKRQKKKHQPPPPPPNDEFEIGDQVCEVEEMTMCRKCYSTDAVLLVFGDMMPCPRSVHCCPHCLSSASEFFREVSITQKREFVLYDGLNRDVWFWLYDPFILKLGSVQIKLHQTEFWT